MALDPQELSSDEGNFDRRLPKRAQKSFDKRRAPTAARSQMPQSNKNINGIHRRRRRQYGV